MFSLLSGMWVYFFGIPQYNVLVLGLDNAGKSTFLYQVGTICDRKRHSKPNLTSKKQSPPNEEVIKPKLKRKSSDNADDIQHDTNNNLDPKLRHILPTMGQNVKLMEFDNMTLQFWDLPGQTAFRKIWSHYYTEVHAIVFMLDSADTARLNEARYELHKLLNQYELKYAPVLVLANKQDLKQAVDYQSIMHTLQIMSTSQSSLNAHALRNNIDEKEQPKQPQLSTIDETKQHNKESNANVCEFKDRSIKVMCTCCLNKDGLSDAISWLVYTIPLAKKRLQHVAQNRVKQMEQNQKKQ